MQASRLRRLRWRLRGAWQWPSFLMLIPLDAVLLHELPIAGDGPDWFAAVVLALFFNLVAVATAGPLIGMALRRRRRDLPRVVAHDRGGTVALIATTAALGVIGLAHRSTLQAQRAELDLQAHAVRRFVAHRPEPEFREYRRNIDRADTLPFGDDLYRTCVPGDDPDRWLCLFVDTSVSPPGLRRDPNPAPNATFVASSGE